MFEDEIATQIVDAAIHSHKALGPGLLESVYVAALGIELRGRALRFEHQVPVQAHYKGQPLGIAFRVDLVVEGRVLVEAKAVQALEPVHTAQLLSCLRLTDLRLGLLLNFNVPLMKDGIKRVANKL